MVLESLSRKIEEGLIPPPLLTATDFVVISLVTSNNKVLQESFVIKGNTEKLSQYLAFSRLSHLRKNL